MPVPEAYIPFDQKLIDVILKSHKETLKKLHSLENVLRKTFYDMDTPIRALILAVLTGESLLLVGPPGTAKSSLIREFCRRIGINPMDEDDRNYFEYLLTQFTEPSELLGYYDILRARDDGELRRKRDGMIQDARIVYLDEVFNASSAILNTLLAMVNERFYHERGEVVPTELDVLFGATNLLPDSDDLRALFDRFLLRCHVGNVDGHEAISVMKMLEKAWGATYKPENRLNQRQRLSEHFAPKPVGPKNSGKANTSPAEDTTMIGILDELRDFRYEIDKHGPGMILSGVPKFYMALAGHITQLRRYNLSQMSNRRLVKFLHLLLVNTMYRQAISGDRGAQVSDSDFGLLRLIVDQPNLPDVHKDRLPKLKVDP